MAYVGGLVLLALVILTCLSVIGRSLNGLMHGDFMQSFLPGFADWVIAIGVGPINGDYELVEAGMAFAIFAFLPLCHIHLAHASVDIFTAMLPAGLVRFLVWISEVVFALVLILIAYQLFLGLTDKFNSGETTLLLEFPIWWAYALSLVGGILAALAGVYMASLRTVELTTGKTIIAEGTGAEH